MLQQRDLKERFLKNAVAKAYSQRAYSRGVAVGLQKLDYCPGEGEVKKPLFWKQKLCERKVSRSTTGYMLLPKLVKGKQHTAGTYALVFPSALVRKTVTEETISLIDATSPALFPPFPKVFHASIKSLEMKTLLKMKWRKKAARLRGLQLFERKSGCKFSSNMSNPQPL